MNKWNRKNTLKIIKHTSTANSEEKYVKLLEEANFQEEIEANRESPTFKRAVERRNSFASLDLLAPIRNERQDQIEKLTAPTHLLLPCQSQEKQAKKEKEGKKEDKEQDFPIVKLYQKEMEDVMKCGIRSQ